MKKKAKKTKVRRANTMADVEDFMYNVGTVGHIKPSRWSQSKARKILIKANQSENRAVQALREGGILAFLMGLGIVGWVYTLAHLGGFL